MLVINCVQQYNCELNWTRRVDAMNLCKFIKEGNRLLPKDEGEFAVRGTISYSINKTLFLN